MTRIALIHALSHSVAPINDAFARDWPEAQRMNLLDDSLSADLARNGKGLDDTMHARFQRLAQYAVDTGAQGILFTCSAFGPCIEAVARRHAGIAVLKPNEAMVEEVAQGQGRLGLIATFAPTLASMQHGAGPCRVRGRQRVAGADHGRQRGARAAPPHGVALTLAPALQRARVFSMMANSAVIAICAASLRPRSRVRAVSRSVACRPRDRRR